MDQNLSPENKKGLRKLTEELRKLSSSIDIEFLDENDDALSLMVDETLKGVDIRKEYPSFFHTLTKNADLRRRYYDAITPDASDTIPDEGLSRNIRQLQAALSELAEKFVKKWQLSLSDLSAVFFPPQNLVYRGASDHSPHYMLLNQEIEIQPVTYSLLLEGTLSDEPDSLSLEVDLAISKSNEPGFAALPVDLEITWGAYSQHVTLSDEGQVTLTDVPFSAFLSADMQQVTSAMELSLSRPQ